MVPLFSSFFFSLFLFLFVPLQKYPKGEVFLGPYLVSLLVSQFWAHSGQWTNAGRRASPWQAESLCLLTLNLTITNALQKNKYLKILPLGIKMQFPSVFQSKASFIQEIVQTF